MPGDRVGVLGVNGVGKSTLMKILAGRDAEYEGDFHIAKGATVGYVSQEPELDFDKTVRENEEEAVCEVRGLLARYDEILKAWEDPAVMEDQERMDQLLEEQGEVQGRLEAMDAMDPAALDARIEAVMDALRLRRGRTSPPLRRRAAPRLTLQGAPRRARRTDPRRADEPPRRRHGRLARELPCRLLRDLRARDP